MAREKKTPMGGRKKTDLRYSLALDAKVRRLCKATGLTKNAFFVCAITQFVQELENKGPLAHKEIAALAADG